MCCVRQNVWFCCLPLKGLFWTSVGGVQVVHLMAKAQTIYSRRRVLSPTGGVCCMRSRVHLFCYCPPCLRINPLQKGKENVNSSKTCPSSFCYLWFSSAWALTSTRSGTWRMFSCLNSSFPPSLSSYSHGHTATHTLTNTHTGPWLSVLLCLPASAWSRCILNYFFLLFIYFHLSLHHQPCLNTHDLAPPVFWPGQNNKLVTHPCRQRWRQDGRELFLIARVCRRVTEKQSWLH